MDDEIAIIERYVAPFYPRLLHGNFRNQLVAADVSDRRARFINEFRDRVAEIEPAIVTQLLLGGWRPRLVGGWYAGLRGWRQFTDELGALLVESRCCFACQGYCAALACFADDASARYLRRYLDVWLPQGDKYYDQHWALPALVWVEKRLGTCHYAEYLAPGGPWERWAKARYRDAREFYLDSQRNFDLTLASALAAFRS